MKTIKRGLTGCSASISISASEDSQEHGFPDWQVNRITIQISAALFGQGCRLLFGHDWREDGVMEAVYSFARQVQQPYAEEAVEAESGPLLLNLIPWPDLPNLLRPDLERLSSTLRVEPAGLPADLISYESKAHDMLSTNADFRYIRARGLTFLRRRLTDDSFARLCIGGRRAGVQGRYPGIIEEALMAIHNQKPIYVAGCLGGAASQIVDAIDGKPMLGDFCQGSEISAIYRNPPIEESELTPEEDLVIDRERVWNLFQERSVEGLSAHNGLSAEENDELLHTPVLDRVIQLVLTGLSRLWVA
jgi:hypothetical protein